jgi:hypothetical protein
MPNQRVLSPGPQIGNCAAQVPNKEQVLALSEELRSRSALPAHVPAVLKALPPGTHPMTQFSTAVLALQARCAPRALLHCVHASATHAATLCNLCGGLQPDGDGQYYDTLLAANLLWQICPVGAFPRHVRKPAALAGLVAGWSGCVCESISVFSLLDLSSQLRLGNYWLQSIIAIIRRFLLL